MKKVLILMTMIVVHSYAFGSNNIFTGKTQPTKGAAAIGVVIGVDDSVLKKAAIADGKSQCFKAGFSYCYEIDETYDTVEDASGFYAQIMVEGFNEVPDKYKPVPVEAIQPPAGSICYFRDARGFGADPIYEVYVYLSEETTYLLGTYYDYTRTQLLQKLKSEGICETHRDGSQCHEKFWGKGYSCN